MLGETEKPWFQMQVDPEEMDRMVIFQLEVKESACSECKSVARCPSRVHFIMV